VADVTDDELPPLSGRYDPTARSSFSPGGRRLVAFLRFQRLRALYDAKHHHPRFAGQAYLDAIDLGVEPPQWVSRHLYKAFETVALLERYGKDRIEPGETLKEIARAFGYTPDGAYSENLQARKIAFDGGDELEPRPYAGRYKALDDHATRDLEIVDAIRIQIAIQERGKTDLTPGAKRTIEAAAKKWAEQYFDVNQSRIARVWTVYRDATFQASDWSFQFDLCKRAGMSDSEAFIAIAENAGLDPGYVEETLQKRLPWNYSLGRQPTE